MNDNVFHIKLLKSEVFYQWPCLITSVNETPDTSTLKVESDSPKIDKSCNIHVETVNGHTDLCGVIKFTRTENKMYKLSKIL